ncbi:hypothetical protein GCM10010172_01730 [Paractinoplanes ferrugineus]|uniref:Uncharacterized protein n=1 Tax=Paractinoplanes ferrugineus TaxID=113564 RepID=A0A919J3W6_9ACTN|nr:hypothetical protein Afe05nite_58600 [Actinoplanes ferrugineus]
MKPVAGRLSRTPDSVIRPAARQAPGVSGPAARVGGLVGARPAGHAGSLAVGAVSGVAAGFGEATARGADAGAVTAVIASTAPSAASAPRRVASRTCTAPPGLVGSLARLNANRRAGVTVIARA